MDCAKKQKENILSNTIIQPLEDNYQFITINVEFREGVMVLNKCRYQAKKLFFVFLACFNFDQVLDLGAKRKCNNHLMESFL